MLTPKNTGLVAINSIELPKNWNAALSTGIDCIDQMFGDFGGVFGPRRGKITMLSAQSGTGKTRLCLTLGRLMTLKNPKLKYAHFAGEQAIVAIRVMGNMMGMEFTDTMFTQAENYWPTIEENARDSKIDVVVIDSFPMLSFPTVIDGVRVKLDIKDKMGMIQRFAEETNCHVILLNHTDKNGDRGGRNELLHLSDVSYTLRKVCDDKSYGGIKVVEFHNEKNREGAPYNRAFPFDGNWNFEMPFEVDGKSGNDTGGSNKGKVEARKQAQRDSLMDMLKERGGNLTRDEIENGTFEIDGMVKSGLVSLLRQLTEENVLKPIREKADDGDKKRGARPIIAWNLKKEFMTEAAAVAI